MQDQDDSPRSVYGFQPTIDPSIISGAALDTSNLYLDIHGGRHYGEKTAYTVGFSYSAGIVLGGTFGAVEGLMTSAPTMKLKINAILNASARRGARLGNGLGIASMMFSGMNFGLSLTGLDQSHLVTQVGAGGLAGILYKSTAGLKAMGVGGLVGAGLIGLGKGGYTLYTEYFDRD